MLHVIESIDVYGPYLTIIQFEHLQAGPYVLERPALNVNDRILIHLERLELLQPLVEKEVDGHGAKQVVRQVQLQHVQLKVVEREAVELLQLVEAHVDALHVVEVLEGELA